MKHERKCSCSEKYYTLNKDTDSKGNICLNQPKSEKLLPQHKAKTHNEVEQIKYATVSCSAYKNTFYDGFLPDKQSKSILSTK